MSDPYSPPPDPYGVGYDPNATPGQAYTPPPAWPAGYPQPVSSPPPGYPVSSPSYPVSAPGYPGTGAYPQQQPGFGPAQWGAPPPSGPKRSNATVVGVIVGVVLFVALVAGAVVVGMNVMGGGGSGSHARAGNPADSASAAGPTDSASPVVTPSTPETTATTPGRPTQPDEALALSDQQATDELTLESSESASQITGLPGYWVPQVSSKCVGVQVDIMPGWFPDGTDDTPHVTIQQILAYHLSMHSRVGALTVRQTQLGIPTDKAGGGPCAGKMIWTAIVPRAYGSAADANGWCSVNVPPVRECAARYVARPGENSKLVLRPGT